MTQPFETTFILFADMLGFADLVEREGEEINELNPIFTGVELYSPSPAENLLGYRFINFHRCINEARPSARDGCWYSNSIFGLSIFPNRDA
jgi:hypothetical protein